MVETSGNDGELDRRLSQSARPDQKNGQKQKGESFHSFQFIKIFIMKVLVSGSHGLIGSALVERLEEAGHAVGRLVRSESKNATDVLWTPEPGALDESRLEGFHAVVHLAGESVVGRWTGAKKKRIAESRVKGTRLLTEAFAKLSSPPRIFLSASAIGFYGDRGDELLIEGSTPGLGFLSQVCRDWELTASRAALAGVRTAYMRFGMVLSPMGGALGKMLPPFKMGLGGPLGTGRQWMSWISIDDAVGAILHILSENSLHGAINVVAPRQVTNLEFTKTLAQTLHRPAFLPMPAFAARLVFGQMADELLLASARVGPTRLISSGYRFKHPELAPALDALLHSRSS